MTEHLTNAPRRGTVAAIPSKSEAHRLLLCAALGRGPVRFACPGTSRDIEATAGAWDWPNRETRSASPY